MGRLAGFRYREIVQRLKRRGFEFSRQAAGSHEIWVNPATGLFTTVPNHPGDMPGVLSVPFSVRPELTPRISLTHNRARFGPPDQDVQCGGCQLQPASLRDHQPGIHMLP